MTHARFPPHTEQITQQKLHDPSLRIRSPAALATLLLTCGLSCWDAHADQR